MKNFTKNITTLLALIFTISFNANSQETICADIDNGAVDNIGNGCSAYDVIDLCGFFDDDDFISQEMCCICGGGEPYIVVYGCTDSVALNYNADAIVDDGNCIFASAYCSGASEDGGWQCDDGLCIPAAWVCDGANVYIGDGYAEWAADCLDGSDESDCGWTAIEDGGCMDVDALNYNADATVDDGSCEYVQGCTDETACNFDAEAQEDNGSCEFAAEGLDCEGNCLSGFGSSLITTYPGEYDNEIGLSITSSTNELVFALSQATPFYDGFGITDIIEGAPIYNAGVFDVCLDPEECYTIKMTDYYGDGWNGAYFTLNNESFSLPSGSEISYNYGQVCEEEVCADSLYSYELSQSSYFGVSIIDFNSNQTLYSVAGGSTGEFCLNPEGCYVLQLSNSLGEIGGDTAYYNYVVAIENQEFYFDQGEVIGGGAYSTLDPYLTTFSDIFATGCIISGCTDPLSDNFNEMAIVNDGSCQLYELGCTDPNALNYNENANSDDGSCEYESIINGCTDPNALNYNENANSDDGSCEYELADCDYESLTVSMSDSWGDGWNGNELTVAGQTVTLEDGSAGVATVCIDMSVCNSIIVTSVQYVDEVSWTLGDLSGGAPYEGQIGDCSSIEGCTDSLALNYDSNALLDDASCEYPIVGCTDESALNYNADATMDDGSCYYEGDVLGCTDESALNYNTDATYDDGSCEYPLSCPDGYILDCDGSGECVPEDWIGDGYADCEDQAYGADLSCYDNDGGDCGVIDGSGCTDPAANNYDSEATEDDGSCYYEGDVPGCLDESALNYNADATLDDGSCQYPISGCTDAEALNFNSDAEVEDGSCQYDCIYGELEEITTTYDCSSFTVWDCDNNEGCSWLNEGFAGFTGCSGGEVTNTDYYCNGNLVVFGCTSTNYLEYDPEANFDDGSCTNITTSIGCMDSEASNYNPEASIDYGLCEYIIDCNTPYVYNDSLINYENNSNITWNFISETGEDLQIDFTGSIEESYSSLWDYINLFDNHGTLISTIDGNLDTSFVLPSGSSVNFISDFSITYAFSFVASLGEGSCIGNISGCTDMSASNFDSLANTDDGSCISWEEAYNTAFLDGVASVEFPECEEVVTQNIPLDLPQGWSMFGYTCLEPLDVMEGFTPISESITIVKDEFGSAYLAAWNFNAIGDFTYGKGYQIKMIEEVTDFQFCPTIIGN